MVDLSPTLCIHASFFLKNHPPLLPSCSEKQPKEKKENKTHVHMSHPPSPLNPVAARTIIGGSQTENKFYFLSTILSQSMASRI